ncbi:MAG: hypothetical protein QOC98_418, partial [Frankiaceae bacterium]|nr:hypothetical protein [Frankiaceae bacterium]
MRSPHRWAGSAGRVGVTAARTLVAGACSSLAGVTVTGAAVTTAGALVLQPLVRPLTQVSKAIPGVVDDVVTLIDPRRDRHRRRASQSGELLSLEIRGLHVADAGPRLAELLDNRLSGTPGVLQHSVNCVWGRLTVRSDPDRVTTEDIARIVAEAEWAAGTL